MKRQRIWKERRLQELRREGELAAETKAIKEVHRRKMEGSGTLGIDPEVADALQ